MTLRANVNGVDTPIAALAPRTYAFAGLLFNAGALDVGSNQHNNRFVMDDDGDILFYKGAASSTNTPQITAYRDGARHSAKDIGSTALLVGATSVLISAMTMDGDGDLLIAGQYYQSGAWRHRIYGYRNGARHSAKDLTSPPRAVSYMGLDGHGNLYIPAFGGGLQAYSGGSRVSSYDISSAQLQLVYSGSGGYAILPFGGDGLLVTPKTLGTSNVMLGFVMGERKPSYDMLYEQNTRINNYKYDIQPDPTNDDILFYDYRLKNIQRLRIE